MRSPDERSRGVARAVAAARALVVMSGPPLLLLALAVATLAATVVAIASGEVPPGVVLVADVAVMLYVVLFVPWTRTWGATPDEVAAVLPGDDLVPERGFTITRAVTIDAPVGDVWPWLAQIGQDRAGFYSYDRLENLAGCAMPRATRVHPEWQHRDVGELVPLHPLNGVPVVRFDPERAFVFAGGWSFVLVPLGPERTRLIARSPVPRSWVVVPYALLFELPHFVMERRMLLGIKERVEHAARATYHVGSGA